MHRLRLTIPAAVSILAVTASAAFAAATAPETGSWRSKKDDSDEYVSFKVVKTASGKFEARSTRTLVAAGCKAPNPNDSTTARQIKASGVTVKLAKSGSQLKGSKTVKLAGTGDKGTQTTKISMTFTSAKRAKVVVKASYKANKVDPKSNADVCGARLSVTASPK